MTISKKEQKVKIVIGLVFIGILLLTFSIKFFNYSSIVKDRDLQMLKVKQDLSKKSNDEKKIKANIKRLIEKKEKLANEGLDIRLIKKDINLLLSSLKNIVNVKLIQADYYKDYNNLLLIKFEVIKEKNDAVNIANLFKIKKILAMDSVKKALSVYGDYKIVGNSISFYALY